MLITLSFFALPFIKKIWSNTNDTSSSGDEKNIEISSDTTFQGGDDKLVEESDLNVTYEEDQVDRMSTDHILQNPLWAAIYRRGWADRSVDIQRSQDIEHKNLDPTTGSSEQSGPKSAVKVRTDAQRERTKKNFRKLKEKIKAKRQLANEQ